MSCGSSPTVWRRWLALELRRLRVEAGVSMKRAADELGCTSTKVSYMEGAQRNVREADLAKLLPLYGVPEGRWETYAQACRDSRRRGWWQRYDSSVMPDWLSLYVGLEQGATQLRSFDPLVIDGLLQTPEYATAVLSQSRIPRSRERIEQLVELRMQRQAVLTRADDPLRVWMILDEAALRRAVGAGEVMRAQLDHLVEMAGASNVTVQVLPFSRGLHRGEYGPFSILGFGWPHDPGVAYVEHYAGAVYLETLAEVEQHSLSFQRLCAEALSPEESVKLIGLAAKDHADD
jgi:transcriptional regulator with XRE-family HTH domain